MKASTRTHVAAGRATETFGRAYAKGTGTYLGRVSAYEFVSLQQTGADSWALVARC